MIRGGGGEGENRKVRTGKRDTDRGKGNEEEYLCVMRTEKAGIIPRYRPTLARAAIQEPYISHLFSNHSYRSTMFAGSVNKVNKMKSILP